MDGRAGEHSMVSFLFHCHRMRLAEPSNSLGDLKFKPFGVTPEPDVRHMLLEGLSCFPPVSSARLQSILTLLKVSNGRTSRLSQMVCPPSSQTRRSPTSLEEHFLQSMQQNASVHLQRKWEVKTTKQLLWYLSLDGAR